MRYMLTLFILSVLMVLTLTVKAINDLNDGRVQTMVKGLVR